MKQWTQIEEIHAGDVVLRGKSEIEVLSIRVYNDYALMTWKRKNATNSCFLTDFCKSTNIADYGLWHSLTSQQWKLKK